MEGRKCQGGSFLVYDFMDVGSVQRRERCGIAKSPLKSVQEHCRNEILQTAQERDVVYAANLRVVSMLNSLSFLLSANIEISVNFMGHRFCTGILTRLPVTVFNRGLDSLAVHRHLSSSTPNSYGMCINRGSLRGLVSGKLEVRAITKVCKGRYQCDSELCCRESHVEASVSQLNLIGNECTEIRGQEKKPRKLTLEVSIMFKFPDPVLPIGNFC
eukprot:g5641.t1